MLCPALDTVASSRRSATKQRESKTILEKYLATPASTLYLLILMTDCCGCCNGANDAPRVTERNFHPLLMTRLVIHHEIGGPENRSHSTASVSSGERSRKSDVELGRECLGWPSEPRQSIYTTGVIRRYVSVDHGKRRALFTS